jgi:A/G-specific adenine glycosylase
MGVKLSTSEIVAFQKVLTGYYYEFGRHDMLWRKAGTNGHFDAYKIMVSELMLQQTQVDRVTPKYMAFLKAFPTVEDLAQATLGEVLTAWNGLGYNRRAKFIWQAAQVIVKEYEGQFPDTISELQKLPGIGPNTAGAIMAYAYNQPVVFIETNIRTVIIHHFFKDKSGIPDKDIREVMEAVVPAGKSDKGRMQGSVLGPREFYWAMMDYGSYLKKTVGNTARASKHYTRQSAFHGSKRQLRGQIIRELTVGPLTLTKLEARIDDERLMDILDALSAEGMISKRNDTYHLS